MEALMLAVDNYYKEENDFYKKNVEMIREKYLDKVIVIIGNQIVGVYDEPGTAMRETKKTHPLGTFCVKEVRAKPELIRVPVFQTEKARPWPKDTVI
jgi:hypothetical protein